jgi:hypothetical protein
MLSENHRQESFAKATLLALAARAGMTVALREYDYGIDLTLNEIGRRGGRLAETGFKLDIQAKSTTTANRTADQVFYDLAVANYNDLRDPRAYTPRLLVVVLLPADEAAWLDHAEDRFVLRTSAYWLSLSGAPETTNTKTIRVAIPRVNLLTVEALAALMARAVRKEPL